MFLRKNHLNAVREPDEQFVDEDMPLPENGLLAKEEYRKLYSAMNRLSAQQRTVLYLRFFEDMKPEEIGRVTGKSLRQVYRLTDKGKARLRELLQNSGIRESTLWDM